MIKKVLFILMLVPLSLFGWKMESGTITLPATTAGSTTWQSINYTQSYDAPPLVFAMVDQGSSGYNGDYPVILRLRNVTASGFEIVQAEATSVAGGDPDPGPHPAVNVHYIVIEPGEHTLPDGTRIVAGTVTTQTYRGKKVSGKQGWDKVTFATPFSSTPVMLARVQTLENETAAIPGVASKFWMTAAIDNVTSNDFDIALERGETTGALSHNETIAYLAIDMNRQGVFYDGNCQAVQFESMLTAEDVKGWENGCYVKSYAGTYGTNPLVIGHMNTRNGGNGGWLRRCSISTTDVGITVDEDQAADTERKHTGESAGLVIFDRSFVYDSSAEILECKLASEYRMDECYWLGTGTFDVMDNVGGNDAEAYNSAQPDQNDAIVNFSGDFSTTGYFQPNNLLTIGSEWSYALWVKFPLDDTGHDDFQISGTNTNNTYYYHALGSIVNDGDLPAILRENGGNDLMWELYDANKNDTVADLPDGLSGWHHFVFVQAGSEIRLYLDGAYYNSISATISGDIEGYLTSFDGRDTQTVGSSADEAKVWNRALGVDEIATLYQNENSGKNGDGTTRPTVTCDASVTANTWELVGIPADFRNSSNTKTTVADIFGDDLGGTYGTDWRIYRRDYSTTDNNSSYTYLSSTDTLDFGKGYWLGSKIAGNWSENGAVQVDYNATNPACTANRCVEIDMKSVTHDFAVDGDDGTGPYRYNMTGFIGKSPVDWADCRFIIDGTAYTPSEAETAGYASKQIWQYNPGNSGANSNGYTTCDDTTPGSCMLEPYKGFWIELHGPTKGKSVKLLVPKE